MKLVRINKTQIVFEGENLLEYYNENDDFLEYPNLTTVNLKLLDVDDKRAYFEIVDIDYFVATLKDDIGNVIKEIVGNKF